jgi:polyisoprenoid-binding protein YceI
MRKNVLAMALTSFALLLIGMAAAGDDYAIDAVHSSVSFQISHLNLSWIHGRFDSFSGDFTLDPSDSSKSSFNMTIEPSSVDTNNKKRDDHLRSPDFFNTKQFPAIKFTSTSVKPVEGGYEVTGDLDFHGTTKPVTFTLKGGNKAEFPKGVQRTGYSTQFTIKRSEFGVNKFGQMLGDDIYIAVGFEGTKK